ncbi:integrase [Pseudarthrobacter sp. NBSH8]|uniref:integrase n=1 Tax=Pseudarthrobacter sp. NBSH8 TaxID=2596911 RepID=UPI0016294FAF|nr:integrase [Pseudarthrobacter sp. NBSH8]QNE15136.1 integrase [Pseudarthrobacter sp. NBSH8]
MATRREITKKHATDYAKSSKTAKGLILDELVAVTGWSRANARRALSTARKRKGPARSVVRKPRGRTYGYDTLKVLISVWRLAGMPSGKYLAATMDLWLPKLEAFGELDAKRLTPAVAAQLMTVSGATIDRLLKPTRDAARPKGLSATKAGPLLRNSITVRKAGDEHEQAPGFIEADMVVHCGPTLAGEFARTLTATDVFTGWTENVAVRNGAHKWVLAAMDEVIARLPFPLVGLDTD